MLSGASFGNGAGRLIPALLFVALPLLALANVAGRHWRALFRRVRLREIAWMIVFALLNVVVSISVAMVVRSLTTTTTNPANALLESASGGERVAFFAATLPQLLGEELLTILPLLALLSFFHARLGWSRRRALIVAVAAVGAAVRARAPADLRLEPAAVRGHHRLGAAGADRGLPAHAQSLGQHRRARAQRLAAARRPVAAGAVATWRRMMRRRGRASAIDRPTVSERAGDPMDRANAAP